MKKTHIKKLIMVSVALMLTVMSCLVFTGLAADDGFEQQIAAFPESYKPYLRELHEKYPNWEFQPMFTYLDFNEAVDNETGEKSLVHHSTASDIYKSRDAGDYNSTTGSYIYKDGGFVEANRLAVSFYLDPRNFLNEEGIFQFELLSFSDNITVEAVEKILKGSFMSEKKITYYTSDGKEKTDSRTYAQVIYAAGKECNINPCYIASKILNEVGTYGSQSVSGKHSTYPGIYNFYNIGATDGEGAITRGLKWAASGEDYLRPWKTPMRSIKGGAEYIGEKYIAKGQFTGYLQRFNVNPESSYATYTHQYMTNLTGALSQGYTTYLSYKAIGLLEGNIVFSIPVYENMPCADDEKGEGSLYDGSVQNGVVKADFTRVRLGPSTDNYDVLADSTGTTVRLLKGTPVKILSKVRTDAKYYASVLQYPYWYYVSFSYNGKTYKGYITENFIDITTQTKVNKGLCDVNYIRSSAVELSLWSTDTKIAQITEDGDINFLKNGTVSVVAYDSLGRFDRVRFTVGDSSTAPKDLQTKVISDSEVSLSFKKSDAASKYALTVVNGVTGEVVLNKSLSSSPYKITGLSALIPYNIFLRGKIDDNTYGETVCVSVKTQVAKSTVTKLTVNAKGEKEIFWDKIAGADGYEVFAYDAESGSYTFLASAKASTGSLKLSAELSQAENFVVRCYRMIDSTKYPGDYSAPVYSSNLPVGEIKDITVTNVTDSGYLISWSKVSGYKYRVYKGSKRVASSSKNSYLAENLTQGEKSSYKLSLYKSVDSVVYEGCFTSTFTASSKPGKITSLKAVKTSDGGEITWAEVVNATHYDIYLYDFAKGRFIKTDSVKTASYSLKGIAPAEKVKIKVVPYIQTTYALAKGKSAAVSFYTAPETVSSVTVSDITETSYTLSWTAAKGANKYCIYRFDEAKGKYVKIASTKKLTYTLTGLSGGRTDKYKIRAVYLVSGKIVASSYTGEYSFSTLPLKVTDLAATKTTSSSVTLSWSSAGDADGYIVYCYDKEKGKFVALKTVKGTSFTVKNLEAGTAYKFRVKAFINLDGEKLFGSASATFRVSTAKS